MNFDLEIQATIILKKMLITRGYTLEEDSKEDFTVRGFNSTRDFFFVDTLINNNLLQAIIYYKRLIIY